MVKTKGGTVQANRCDVVGHGAGECPQKLLYLFDRVRTVEQDGLVRGCTEAHMQRPRCRQQGRDERHVYVHVKVDGDFDLVEDERPV